jgi:hypothetical protein
MKELKIKSDSFNHTLIKLQSTIDYFMEVIILENDISKLDIKTVCGVSEVTINKCFKKLDIIKSNLIPNCILDKYC